LHKTLDSLFSSAAVILEKLIAKGIFDALSLPFESHANWTLVDYINYAKTARRLEKTS
jgi:hypothetical protein